MARRKKAKVEIADHNFKSDDLRLIVKKIMGVREEQSRNNKDAAADIKGIMADKMRALRESELPSGERDCLQSYRLAIGLQGELFSEKESGEKKKRARRGHNSAPEHNGAQPGEE